MLSVAAGACQGCPSPGLPWIVRDQPSACWMTRAGREAKREACGAWGDGGERVSAAGIGVSDVHDGLQVVGEGDRHGGVWAQAEASHADDAGCGR